MKKGRLKVCTKKEGGREGADKKEGKTDRRPLFSAAAG
jgi:hypothetical protein